MLHISTPKVPPSSNSSPIFQRNGGNSWGLYATSADNPNLSNVAGMGNPSKVQPRCS